MLVRGGLVFLIDVVYNAAVARGAWEILREMTVFVPGVLVIIVSLTSLY